MDTPVFHIVCPTSHELVAHGLSAFFKKLGHQNVQHFSPALLPPKKHCSHLMIVDECLPPTTLHLQVRWEKLILIYTPAFPLTQDHIFQLPHIYQGLCLVEDLTLKTLDNYLDLLDSDIPFFSGRIIRLLMLPTLQLSPIDKQLITALAQGETTTTIMQQIGVSRSTLERHKRMLKERLGCEQLTDCALLPRLWEYGYRFSSLKSEEKSAKK